MPSDSQPNLVRVHNAVEAPFSMAAKSLRARLQSELEAEFDALRRELALLRWLTAIGFAALALAAIAQLFRSGG